MIPKRELMDKYELLANDIVVGVSIYSDESEPVPLYQISITNISETTKIILEKIREEFVSQETEALKAKEVLFDTSRIQEQFKGSITKLLRKYFPTASKKTMDLLINYVLQQNIGLGHIEILLKDINLEEIVINNAFEPVWVYHRKYSWLKTNVRIPNEARIRHYSTVIGRDVGKEITVLNPLMDAHLLSGDRVNATLSPISSRGNTITIRKFAVKPWTVTDFIKEKTLSYEVAALIWMAVQNELSIIIAGGTASGKTSMLNVVSNFFPPNQRIISLEDTRELTLPNSLHWVPLETRLPNPEGKGGINMLDLVVNSLRMRPDRIIVGEIRRKAEAEVLFEAMHTGHSVYGTLHANNVRETVNRLTHPPIDLPKQILSALSLIVVQNINRKTGKRRTLQVGEVLQNGDAEPIIQLNVLKDELELIREPTVIYKTLKLYTGLAEEDIQKDISEKVSILKWMVKNNITDLNKIGLIMSNYYRKKPFKQFGSSKPGPIMSSKAKKIPFEYRKKPMNKLLQQQVKQSISSRDLDHQKKDEEKLKRLSDIAEKKGEKENKRKEESSAISKLRSISRK